MGVARLALQCHIVRLSAWLLQGHGQVCGEKSGEMVLDFWSAIVKCINNILEIRVHCGSSIMHVAYFANRCQPVLTSVLMGETSPPNRKQDSVEALEVQRESQFQRMER